MKFSLATVVAVAGLFTSVLAGPVPADTLSVVEARQNDGTAAKLDELAAQVDTITGSIDQKLNALPANPTAEQRTAASDSIADDIKKLEEALATANKAISANAKRSEHIEERAGGCPRSCITDKANKIVVRITITIKLTIRVLGRECVPRYVRPIIIELRGLLVCLDRLIAGLLRAVGTLLCSLLGGLGLDDLLNNLLGNLLGGVLQLLFGGYGGSGCYGGNCGGYVKYDY